MRRMRGKRVTATDRTRAVRGAKTHRLPYSFAGGVRPDFETPGEGASPIARRLGRTAIGYGMAGAATASSVDWTVGDGVGVSECM